MGQLAVSCIAHGTDNSLYALALGYNNDVKPVYNENAIFALIKSNASPSGPEDLKWEVISTINQDELNNFGKTDWIKCAIDPNGSFLAWAYYTERRSADGKTMPQTRPGGIRYDPSLSKSSASSTGKGGWVNVDSPLNYKWTWPHSPSTLFYIKNASGKYDFYHAYTTGSTYSFGALSTTTTPNVMENTSIDWQAINLIPGGIGGILATTNKLFMWGITGDAKPLFSRADIPESGPLPASPFSFQFGNYSTPYSCPNPVARGDHFYKFCEDSVQHGTVYKLYSWDGSRALDPIDMPEMPSSDWYKAAQLAIFGESPKSFMLVQSGYLDPRSKLNSGGYKLTAVSLSGNSAGTFLSFPNNITVKDNISYLINPETATTETVGMSTIVKWVIGFFAACFAIGFIWGLFRYYLKQLFFGGKDTNQA